MKVTLALPDFMFCLIPGTPDVLLNPKKKVWEQVQPDLKINTEGKPTYKGVPWNILGKGECQVPTMRECGIK